MKPLAGSAGGCCSTVILNRYADPRIDLADACLIWLAGQEKTHRVLTTDRRDFSVYRGPDGRPFERVWLTDEA